MRCITAALCVVVLYVTAAKADDHLDRQTAALKVIRDTAADICYTIEQRAQKSESQIAGDVEAKISGAVSKLVDLGVKGSGSARNQTSEGVTQEALASSLQSSAACRLGVFNKLVERMLPLTSPPPITSSALGGWLDYAIGPCTGKGTSDISCDGVFQNISNSDHHLATFVTQKSGIRSTAFDKFGLITAIDNNGSSYIASTFRAANRVSGETGQLGFTLLPGIKTKIVIDFDKVDLSATSFARLTIPFADEAKVDGRKLDMVIENIAFQ